MIKILSELSSRNLLNEFTIGYDPDNRIFYKEWFFGTNKKSPTLFHKSNSRFALKSSGVCYLALDARKIGLEVNKNSKTNISINSQENPFPEMLNEVLHKKLPNYSKLKLNSTIRLFSIGDDKYVDSLDGIFNDKSQKQDTHNTVRKLIEGSNEIYEESIEFSEAIRSVGFDGILYKSNKMETDIMSPFNDPMLVVYEPLDGRELFTDIVLSQN